ncbi:MAG: hypothetical protein R3A44_22340 [Caldilineaceae bacterium]
MIMNWSVVRRLDRYEVIILDDIGYVQQSRDEMEVLPFWPKTL